MTKDYYGILGLLDDAEDVVIRAAYKALAQRYHPDKWTGNKEEANRRMQEINEAYGVLSDSSKRKQYDATRDKSEYQTDTQSDAEESFRNTYLDDWKKVIEYFPKLDVFAKNLQKISSSLEFSFKSILIEQKRFNDAQMIAEHLENNFFEKYFGKNVEIRSFAKTLILNKQKDAAKELNAVVNLFGSDVDPSSLIANIKIKFGINQFGIVDRAYDIETITKIKKLADNVIKFGFEDDCLELVKFIGGKLSKESMFDPHLILKINSISKKLKMNELIDLAKKIAMQIKNSEGLNLNISI